MVCISPWNFPLAIFTGQVAAALAAGCTVLAKPAEQTPLVAAEAVRLLHRAGVPRGALQLLPGAGETVGAALVADARVRGVLFTGSTAVARTLQRALAGRFDAAGRPPLLIAETGGINALIVDSSALAEQVVADALASAFDSAGQRCSALRLLCVQEDVADRTIEMLKGAMDELRVGRPDRLAVDVGPVIDDEAREAIEAHVEAMRAQGRRVYRRVALPRRGDDDGAAATRLGSFVVPTLIELDDARELTREVFGPVLHVVRWRRETLPALLDAIDATGYALTLGLHTRLDETIELVTRRSRAGNVYVNRNMIGAVVGVQPFGGEGLSGTGPKAGGPLYLRRLLAPVPDSGAPQLSAMRRHRRRPKQATRGRAGHEARPPQRRPTERRPASPTACRPPLAAVRPPVASRQRARQRLRLQLRLPTLPEATPAAQAPRTCGRCTPCATGWRSAPTPTATAPPSCAPATHWQRRARPAAASCCPVSPASATPGRCSRAVRCCASPAGATTCCCSSPMCWLPAARRCGRSTRPRGDGPTSCRARCGRRCSSSPKPRSTRRPRSTSC